MLKTKTFYISTGEKPIKRQLKLEPAFFEIGPRNYLFGDQILDLARIADEAAEKYDVRVIFTAPYANIKYNSYTREDLPLIHSGGKVGELLAGANK